MSFSEIFWMKNSNGESAKPQKSQGCKLCNDSVLSKEPFYVRTHEGTVVECMFNYCPVCGRKLPSDYETSE